MYSGSKEQTKRLPFIGFDIHSFSICLNYTAARIPNVSFPTCVCPGVGVRRSAPTHLTSETPKTLKPEKNCKRVRVGHNDSPRQIACQNKYQHLFTGNCNATWVTPPCCDKLAPGSANEHQRPSIDTLQKRG